jgi:hypothetical protein
MLRIRQEDVPVHALNLYSEWEFIAQFIINLNTREK